MIAIGTGMVIKVYNFLYRLLIANQVVPAPSEA